MNIRTFFFAIFAVLGLELSADDQLAPEINRFMGLPFAERVSEAVSLSKDERLRRISELEAAAIRNPTGKDSYRDARAFLGDEEALGHLIEEFLKSGSPGSGVLGYMENPRIIELVAPEFFRNEPMFLGGGDTIFLPRSFCAAELALEILKNTPAFNSDVINWARATRGLTWSEKRELVRPWWKANEQFFREKNYQAVQPGPPPPRDPYASERPEAPRKTVPVATPAIASPPPATPIAQTPVAAVEQPSPGWPWLVGIVVLVVVIAFVLKRRV